MITTKIILQYKPRVSISEVLESRYVASHSTILCISQAYEVYTVTVCQHLVYFVLN
jgi:hypothetical protein